MSAIINNEYQTNLLFKRFTGVAATQLDQQFSNEPYRSITNIFSRDIMIEEVPSEAPVTIFLLDNSGNWGDSTTTGAPSQNSGQSFSQTFPDSHLEFYKNLELDVVPGSNSRVWYKLDSSGNNILRDTINFKFDDINSSYLMRVKYNNGSVYINNAINSFPLFWVLDNQSGYLQLYQNTATLSTSANIPANPPKISFFKYVGKKGLLNLDISGQQQVADISGIDNNVFKLNRMIMPDGYVDISGTDYDLCGNEAVRTYYDYIRTRQFIGYDTMPSLDGSAIDHQFDPSHSNPNGVGERYELDVSGNIYFSNRLSHGTSYAGAPNAVAFGNSSVAMSDGAFTIGLDCSSLQNYTFTAGHQTEASGTGAFAHGQLTNASGNFTHAEGLDCSAIADYSHSEGKGNIIDTEGGHVTGLYNDISKNIIFSVGCGKMMLTALMLFT